MALATSGAHPEARHKVSADAASLIRVIGTEFRLEKLVRPWNGGKPMTGFGVGNRNPGIDLDWIGAAMMDDSGGECFTPR